ncbi:IS630 family transposase [Bradyrhizobium sp. CCBAU 51765]|nr:IS630 family transposase [Bradyrhizobium sp. CCBAU 51765]
MVPDLSIDLRKHVLAAVAGRMSCREAAAHFRVGVSSAIRWVAQARRTGEVTPKPQGGDRRSRAIEGQAERILALIATKPDNTLEELKAALAADGHTLQRLRIVTLLPASEDHAQKKTVYATEQERPDVLKKREEWSDGQIGLDPARLIFIDETWASTNMARMRGRAPRGHRCGPPSRTAVGRRTTFVAGLRLSGMVAPMVLDGPINGLAFQAYVDQVLVPELREGDVVVMDNLGSHKGAGVRAAIEATGASSFISRPTAPISIRSRTPSPNSKRCCAPL